MGRGTGLPLLRPYEAIGLLVGIGVVLHVALAGRENQFRFEGIDAAIILMAVASSVYPLFVMKLRGRDIQQEDVLYAFQLWKYYGIFLIMRLAIRTPKQVRAALVTAVVAACIVGIIAALQSLQIGGVESAIGHLFPADDPNVAATS